MVLFKKRASLHELDVRPVDQMIQIGVRLLKSAYSTGHFHPETLVRNGSRVVSVTVRITQNTRAFSSQAGSPDDSENATNQKLRAFDLIQSDRKTL